MQAKAERRAKRDAARLTAQAFIAEIEALSNFLKSNEVCTKLRMKARANERLYFHPGEEWLRTYSVDPTSVGKFPPDLAADLVTYFVTMRNELGRLIWLHTLEDNRIGEPNYLSRSGLSSEMTNTATTLDSLLESGGKLKVELGQFVDATSPRFPPTSRERAANVH